MCAKYSDQMNNAMKTPFLWEERLLTAAGIYNGGFRPGFMHLKWLCLRA